ncbi:transmembrane protein 248-like [Styela clava]|uniref:transmembrane protein 248-like n=1 Tax=Styela clava TaxID=7725 RepID=UPI00193A9387|nr:transmembrane protein 248-like [Styela clava]
MAFSPLENFRNFLSARPPLVLFVVCIGMTAIAFISYAYYIKYNDVYNPDANERLNAFVENATNLNLCTKLSNKSWTTHNSENPRDVNLSQILLNDNNMEETDLRKYKTVSFLVTVSVSFLPKSDSFPRPITDFVSSFPVSVLGISGKDENKTVAMEFVPRTPTNLKCADNKKVCLVEYEMCATIMAPEDIVPCARQQTNKCSFERDNSTSAFIAWLDVTTPSKNEKDHSLSQCKSNILLKATKVREQLTIMLTLEKRSVANMHLMHSSYFLFVIIITILLFGIITGGERKHSRNQNNHYSMMNSGSA